MPAPAIFHVHEPSGLDPGSALANLDRAMGQELLRRVLPEDRLLTLHEIFADPLLRAGWAVEGLGEFLNLAKSLPVCLLDLLTVDSLLVLLLHPCFAPCLSLQQLQPRIGLGLRLGVLRLHLRQLGLVLSLELCTDGLLRVLDGRQAAVAGGDAGLVLVVDPLLGGDGPATLLLGLVLDSGALDQEFGSRLALVAAGGDGGDQDGEHGHHLKHSHLNPLCAPTFLSELEGDLTSVATVKL